MLDTLHFDNQFTRELPVYPNAANFRRQVNGACYSRVAPTPVAAPHLIAYAHEVSHVELISELLEVQQQVETDMTIFFRCLALLDTSPATSDEALLANAAHAWIGSTPNMCYAITLCNLPSIVLNRMIMD